MRQFDVVQAEFRPTITDTLKPGVETMIGRVGEWEAMWIIEDGPYEGHWAMQPQGELLNECLKAGRFAWVPSCDLDIREAA